MNTPAPLADDLGAVERMGSGTKKGKTMKENDSYKGRKTQQFWGVVDNNVCQVTGYECHGMQGYWWVPDLGYSQHEDYLHKTEGAALTASIAEAEEFERGIQTQLKILCQELEKLPRRLKTEKSASESPSGTSWRR